MKLYVGNLSFATSSQDLREIFATAGTVESAYVVEDRDTGRSRGFTEMSRYGQAEKAMLLGSTDITRERERHGNRTSQRVPGPSKRRAPEIDRSVEPRVAPEARMTQVEANEDSKAQKQLATYFAEIAESRKRSRNVKVEIDRLKKKTQAIIDRLS